MEGSTEISDENVEPRTTANNADEKVGDSSSNCESQTAMKDSTSDDQITSTVQEDASSEEKGNPIFIQVNETDKDCGDKSDADVECVKEDDPFEGTIEPPFQDTGKSDESILPDVGTVPEPSNKVDNEKTNTETTESTEGPKFKVRDITTMYDQEQNVPVEVNKKCSSCNKTIVNDGYLSWETMDFCSESCLLTFQRKNGSTCVKCKLKVSSLDLGKYCVRFGRVLRQFCNLKCLDAFKKTLKVCNFCQTDLQDVENVLTHEVNDTTTKHFCSEECKDLYLEDKIKFRAAPGTICSVCKLPDKNIENSYFNDEDATTYYFCGYSCFKHFQFVNNCKVDKCHQCRKYFSCDLLSQNVMIYDDVQCFFCSITCKTIYTMRNRKIAYCERCSVKKYNFDMIRKKVPYADKFIVVCSTNCLVLQQAALNSKEMSHCSYCNKVEELKFHVSQVDGTIVSVCSYACAIEYKKTQTNETSEEGRVQTRSGIKKQISTPKSDKTVLPVITSVMSLAPATIPVIRKYSNRSKRIATANPPTMHNSPESGKSTEIESIMKQVVVWKIEDPPPLRNVATMAKPIKLDKSVFSKPTTASVACQTDDYETVAQLKPLPVPFFIPSPMPAFQFYVPKPTPFILPVPVPVFIPTTKLTSINLMKEFKKVQVHTPTDPYEADLLMMAELVAAEAKKCDDGQDDDTGQDAESFTSDIAETSMNTSLGEDMLQMALTMASYTEPPVDLEGALEASTITATHAEENPVPAEEIIEPSAQLERQSKRGRRTTPRVPRQNTSRRGRRPVHHIQAIPPPEPEEPPPPPEPIEKPDANMCLKYTFGVNAWKQWVSTKNAELEKSIKKVKLFKTEIMQMTADELNISLALFVKEVRRPNGAEYAPDTIYYLCLGIQQYLYENGRIDNIFCDPYYEPFTDCLDEVCRKFTMMYNDSQYIVTRVEEEHLWESKQLGAHSPHVLLTTLMFFNTKHFNLVTVDDHLNLSFSHIMKHWKRGPNQTMSKGPVPRNVLLRFYPPSSSLEGSKKKKVYEQQENEENPLRCPVKLYEFYLSKCPESVKTRNDIFYLMPERSCVPDSPVWYSTMPLAKEALQKMLHRVKMVKEINVALLTSQF